MRVVLAKKLLRYHHDIDHVHSLSSFLWSTSQTMTSDFVAISALCGCWICLTTEPFCDLNTFMCSHNHTTNQHHKVASSFSPLHRVHTIHTYQYMYINLHVCFYYLMCMHTHTRTHTHTHTHTNLSVDPR